MKPTISVLFLGGALAACAETPAARDASSDVATDAVNVSDVAPDVAVDAPPALTPVTVMTTRGAVIGRSDTRVQGFLGIPYAAPPLGALRWRAPTEPPMWTAPRDASTRGAACMQAAAPSGSGLSLSEDCLTLNVWSPPPQSSAPRPVMVFIHGGGFQSGSGGEPTFDGRNLAMKGNVVVVTLNYRLGQFGFLAHPSLTAEDTEHHSSGNYGFMDQQLALRWVRDNAAAFGGDPANVTLFGESAGSIAVCAHLVSPASQGLFHKAIFQSGVCSILVNPLHDATPATFDSAESLGRSVATTLGCDTASDVGQCMREKPAAMVLAAQARPFELTLRARFLPNIDGYLLPDAPARLLRTGAYAHVPVMLGTNRDEGTYFALVTPTATQPEFESAVRAITPDHLSDVTRVYPSAMFASLREVFSAFVADAVFVCTSRLAARQMAANEPRQFLYHFTRLNPTARLLSLGVFHTAELPYVFSNFNAPFSGEEEDQAVSDLVVGYWSRFAATGDPNGAGAPMWPRYTQAADTHLEIGTTTQTGTGLHRAQCDEAERWLPVQ